MTKWTQSVVSGTECIGYLVNQNYSKLIKIASITQRAMISNATEDEEVNNYNNN